MDLGAGEGHDALQSGAGLGKRAALLPKPPHRRGRAEGDVGIFHGLGPVQGGPQVVVLALQSPQPLGLPLPDEVRLRLLGQVAEVLGVPPAQPLFLLRGAEPLGGEFMDGLEHLEPEAPIRGLLLTHQALVDEGEQPIQHVGGQARAAHRFGRLQGPSATKDCEAREQPLFLCVQEIMGPRDCSAEGPLTLRDVTGAAAEQGQALL